MKTRTFLSALGVTLLIGVGSSYGAVVITAVGDGTGYDVVNQPSWRSTGAAKTFDIDGDDVYGTEGAWAARGTTVNSNGQPFTVSDQVGAAWATFAGGSDFVAISRQTSYLDIDKVTEPISAAVADWTAPGIAVSNNGTTGAWLELVQFDITTSAPASFRLGVMSAIEGNADGRWDPTGIRLSYGGDTATPVTALENLGNSQASWVFFDVTTDGTAGTFSIEAQRRLSNGGAAISAVSIDVVPEPSHGILLLLGIVPMIWPRRRLP